ncbi:SRPBCC family protein [Paractinoplanes atraurantiacus]|uniref:Polyketide cyclase / dehydrase and lipid transport n=1 Tax=Paractinoplanes atraurantiacus TaxID=1036182 RepID=A0A285F3B6_9ACTN|nr:SRPBCC family protein [Actinoplanes atraurantiacus]SNY05214.1 Polyketide cyclase / dehydrase and lipid transport [Actinoplanes atraurantiacus]
MSMVQQAIEVSAPLHTVYEQLAAFENYPRFMRGVREVTSIGGDQTHWIMDVEGKTREFDAQITERRVDERVSWSTMEGPLLAETLTLRPLGETKTQVVAQLEADIAFLMPNDRHGQQSLTRRLKDDLTAFKGMVEGGASTKRLAPSPAAVAARARHRPPHPGAGWGTSAAERSNASTVDLPHHGGLAANTGTNVDITSAPGIRSARDLDDVLPPGRRIAKTGPVSGAAGTAPMGGRTPQKDAWGDGMINEEDRGSHSV